MTTTLLLDHDLVVTADVRWRPQHTLDADASHARGQLHGPAGPLADVAVATTLDPAHGSYTSLARHLWLRGQVLAVRTVDHAGGPGPATLLAPVHPLTPPLVQEMLRRQRCGSYTEILLEDQPTPPLRRTTWR